LPPMFKRAMRDNAHGELAVREDLFHNYFGYRHMSISNNKFLKKFTPAVMMRLLGIAEKMWQEFIKITKVDILVKMPVVIFGNMVSNFMYGVMTGTNPIELLRDYTESARDVGKYFQDHTELIELRLAKRTGNVDKRDVNKIKVLERRLEANPINELAELGIYQSIIEDMDHKELDSTNKLKKAVDDKLSGAPEIVKQGLDMLYLTENTKYFKMMNEVLTKSDLIARDVQNRKLKRVEEKQANGDMALPKWYVEKGVDKLDSYKYKKTTKQLHGETKRAFLKEAAKYRHSKVLNTFINYNKASGKYEEYLNKMGAIMFTKYAKRIQKVLTETAATNPLNVLLTILSEEALGDVETIFDQSLLTRSWYNMGISDGDMIPGTNPFTRIMDMMEPPLVRLATGDGF